MPRQKKIPTRAERVKTRSLARRKTHYNELLEKKRRVLLRDMDKVDGRTIPKKRRPRPTTGQSAPYREVHPASLNSHELEVWSAAGKKPLSVADLAALAGLTNLEVRNALRRLVRGGYVKHTEARGQYVVGSKQMKSHTRKAA